ncbi:unnamed protein product [Polarella glacialis]|uniref:Uncharacterized protein n=1 Tax=Polarella glacialis TaxID=89957 RepID=A0A813DQQ6_POLGL|nr:unnamed protein product [Polarella glacialis]
MCLFLRSWVVQTAQNSRWSDPREQTHQAVVVVVIVVVVVFAVVVVVGVGVVVVFVVVVVVVVVVGCVVVVVLFWLSGLYRYKLILPAKGGAICIIKSVQNEPAALNGPT